MIVYADNHREDFMFTTALMCLALNVYHESRNQSLEGQVAVAQVTMNRVRSNRYPKDVCSVVVQKGQFSWTADKLEVVRVGKKAVGFRIKESGLPKNKKAWRKAVKIAKLVYDDQLIDYSKGALFYHTKQVKPHWKDDKYLVADLGSHLFYSRDKSLVSYN